VADLDDGLEAARAAAGAVPLARQAVSAHDREPASSGPQMIFTALRLAPSLLLSFVAAAALAQPANGPSPLPMPPAIPAPADIPYPGTIRLAVDATDTRRGIFQVHETIPVTQAGPLTLLFPKWLPGNHGPTGPIDKLAGLVIRAGAASIAWSRDPVDVYAFHIDVPKGVGTVDVSFQFLSPVEGREGRVLMTPDMLSLEWNTVVLYPAGYFSRRIMVEPSAKFPSGWKVATALETANVSGASVTFKPVPFNTLVDSPLIAGRYFTRIDLDPGHTQVHLDIVADDPDDLAATPAEIQIHRNLVQQAYRAFGSHHYDHYDFLFSLSDTLGGIGLEHHRSSEDGTTSKYFAEWDSRASSRSLLSHEFTHSWNGKFRRPADLWTPNFNVPMRDSLLWVYEGQTQYWGEVLAARSGLWSKQQALDAFAGDAASMDVRLGRQWRPLEDTTADPITSMRRPIAWRTWQRSEDYYVEGALIWLDVDTLIRQRSGGKKSLDDFARAFFGINDGSYVTATYTFDDIVRGLNAVMPYDWKTFLQARVEQIAPAPLNGLKQGGYKLVFTDTPSDYFKSNEKNRKSTDLGYSIGLVLDSKGAVTDVAWDSAAFNAGVTVGAELVAVNGTAFSGDALKKAVRDAAKSPSPIQLLVKRGDQYRTLAINYRGGLRYPHLERIPGTPALLDNVLAPRP
jgi:predicted metalloprotease with PDZ domain